ncbi:hypothetical protein HER39_13270, partial [Arthrobacter deserti]|nr:hypothetical protein [Arthrobacter deserti]
MRYPKRLPPHLSGTSFAVAEGLEAGLTGKQLLGRSVRVPSRGVRGPAGAELNLAARGRALSWVTPGSVVSHSTAARLWGFPLPAWLGNDPAVHITRPGTLHAPRRREVIGHSALLHPDETTVHDGVRL